MCAAAAFAGLTVIGTLFHLPGLLRVLGLALIAACFVLFAFTEALLRALRNLQADPSASTTYCKRLESLYVWRQGLERVSTRATAVHSGSTGWHVTRAQRCPAAYTIEIAPSSTNIKVPAT